MVSVPLEEPTLSLIEEEFYSLEDNRGWHSLFQQLHHIAKAQAGSQLEARRPINLPRNRYRDVLPIDETRVKLEDECDYINANYVKVEDVNRSYILSQGPLNHTSPHFWQMIWEQNSKGIVMLNKCVERGMQKCHPYWPQGQDEPEVMFGQFKIELISIEDYYSFRLSHLQLQNTETEETRLILHYHYTKWPDFGVPKTADDFLAFLDSVRSGGVLNEDVGPCVVHCSAGIGRSGTFCLVDVCLKKISDTGDPNSVDVRSILLDMRRQRLGLIQTPDQLRFSYIAIIQRVFSDGDQEEESQEEGSESEEVEEEEDDKGEGSSSHSNGVTKKVDIYKYRDDDDSDDEDVPPPLPPRPPDLLRDQDSPSPPPPPTLPPPGPPTFTRPPEDPAHYVRHLPDPDEEVIQPWYEKNSDDDEGDDEPPPLPPPRLETTLLGKRDQEQQEEEEAHFLSYGRGGDEGTPPLVPPPIPPRDSQLLMSIEGSSNSFEEEALIKELTELERLVDRTEEEREQQRVNVEPTPSLEYDPKIREANELRRRQREERQSRLQSKVNSMKDTLRTQETRDSTVPWLLVTVTVFVVGYSMYYFWVKS